jgi:transposase-like protein
LGIGDGTLGNWVRQARTDREGLTTEEKAELAALRKESSGEPRRSGGMGTAAGRVACDVFLYQLLNRP